MGQKTILLVDDEKDLSETISMMLEVSGEYKVVSACNGKEGIKKAYLVKPDLILLDIKMPEMDGIETLKILKEGPSTASIPVVMLTACDEDVFKLKTSQLYNEDYLIKPIKAEELLSRLEKVFKRREGN
ncbi:MAG: response regulator [Candidatus Omnitrophica bacterium]|nr:response regulator [Candidatus Omnitrophota bacterium]